MSLAVVAVHQVDRSARERTHTARRNNLPRKLRTLPAIGCRRCRRINERAPSAAPPSWHRLHRVALTAWIGFRENHARSPQPTSVSGEPARFAPCQETIKQTHGHHDPRAGNRRHRNQAPSGVDRISSVGAALFSSAYSHGTRPVLNGIPRGPTAPCALASAATHGGA